MPSLGSHLASARLLADRLAHRSVDADRGSFYVGATAPDIRVITRLDRSEYHFFSLDDFESQDAVARLFETHPAFRNAVELDVPTRAFMAGYLTHLVMDQDYIESVYRRHFGAQAWGDDARGDVLDRVLQFEMDRRERERPDVMDEVSAVLADASVAADVAFIGRETLGRWVDVVRDIATQPPTWDRFPQMMNRHLQRAGYSEDEIAEICENVPAILAETLDHVSEAAIAEFLERTMDRSLAQVREYLQ
ncbi:MAG: zinc dependent phospholipase C family protein [Dehalococcoidia bacterium]